MQLIEQIAGLTEKYEGHFQSEIRLTPQIFQLLNDLTLSSEIPSNFKVQLYAAMGYFVAPYDIFPEETFGAIGYVDDLMFALNVLHQIKDRTVYMEDGSLCGNRTVAVPN